jgi:hypothetical protein
MLFVAGGFCVVTGFCCKGVDDNVLVGEALAELAIVVDPWKDGLIKKPLTSGELQ